MSDETTDPTTDQVGGPPPKTGKYRAKLDAALADAARWRDALVQRVAAEHQLSPDDLDEFDDPDTISGHARLLHQQREAANEKALAAAREAKELSDDERQTALDRLLGKEPIPKPRPETAQDRHNSIRGIGAPPARTATRDKDEGGFGAERAKRTMTRQVAEGRFRPAARQTTERDKRD